MHQRITGQALHIDVTIANPTGPSYLHNGNSSQIKHFAIKDKEKLKNDKYLRRCQDINTEFMPLAFEIYGSASVSVNKLIQDLASTAARKDLHPLPCVVVLLEEEDFLHSSVLQCMDY